MLLFYICVLFYIIVYFLNSLYVLLFYFTFYVRFLHLYTYYMLLLYYITIIIIYISYVCKRNQNQMTSFFHVSLNYVIHWIPNIWRTSCLHSCAVLSPRLEIYIRISSGMQLELVQR